MSHHIHVFLSNEPTAEDAIGWINSQFDDAMLASNWVDRAMVLGAINLATGEYTPDRYNVKFKESDIKSIQDLENYANRLFSRERYLDLINQAESCMKAREWWQLSRIARQLDGMKYAVQDNKKWTAKKNFCINDGYLDMPGITDWTGVYEIAEDCGDIPTEYAVIVDFHS